jgi:hypothetical protein
MNTPQLSEVQVAYLAGLIDGEGSLESQKQVQAGGKTPRYVLRLSFTFVTVEPLATLSLWLGVPVKVYASTDPRRSDRRIMHIPKSMAVVLLERCLPYLILKRRQAELILGIEAIRHASSPSLRHFGSQSATPMPLEAIGRMEALHVELRSLKSNKRTGRSRAAV